MPRPFFFLGSHMLYSYRVPGAKREAGGGGRQESRELRLKLGAQSQPLMDGLLSARLK